jgi:hypothetical protein
MRNQFEHSWLLLWMCPSPSRWHSGQREDWSSGEWPWIGVCIWEEIREAIQDPLPLQYRLGADNSGRCQTIRGQDWYWLSSKTRDLNRCCTVASASPALGHGKAIINLWAYDYGTVKGTLTSEDSRSMSSVVMRLFKILVHFGVLVVIICFLITNYFVSQVVT